MQVKSLTVGPLQTNCYLLVDDQTNQTIIIDPGDEADFISSVILENKLIPVGILLTHGHYDHCLGVLELKLNFNIPIYLHQSDLFLYQKAAGSAKFWSKKYVIPGMTRNPYKLIPLPTIDIFLEDNQIIYFGESSLKVIHTPGHTPGSCSFLTNESLFSGDTLFATGAGKADHSYSSKLDLKNSLLRLQSTIHNLPAGRQVYIYPGHENFGFELNY